MRRIPQVVKAAAGLASVRVGVRLMGILVGWVVALRLGPEGLGQLSIPNLLLSFGPFLGLGFSDGLVRELPRNSSATMQERLRSTAFFMTLAGLGFGLIVLLGPLHTTLAAWIPDDRLLVAALLAFSFHAIYKYIYSDLVGSQQIFRIGLLQLLQGAVRACAVLVFLFILPAHLRVISLHVGVVLSFASAIFWFHRTVGALPRPRFDATAFFKLLRSGPGIALAGFGVMLLVVGDRLYLKSHLDLYQMGLFEQAVLIRDALLLLPAVIMTLLLPNFSRPNPDPDAQPKLMRRVRQHSWTLAIWVPLCLAPLALLVRPVTQILLPRFCEGIPLYQLTVLSMSPIYISYILMSLLLARGKAGRVVLAALVSIALVAALDLTHLSTAFLLTPEFLQTFSFSDHLEPILSAGLHAGLAFLCFAVLLFSFGRREIALPWNHLLFLFLPSLGVASVLFYALQMSVNALWPVLIYVLLSLLFVIPWIALSGNARHLFDWRQRGGSTK
jgi:O-antigen/teichoic acid export membrane protein